MRPSSEKGNTREKQGINLVNHVQHTAHQIPFLAVICPPHNVCKFRQAIKGRQSVSVFGQVSDRSHRAPWFLESVPDPGSLFHPGQHQAGPESEKWPQNAIPSWEKVVGIPLELKPENLNSKLRGMSRILKPRISCYSPLWKATKNGFPAARTFLHSLINDSLDAPSTPTIIVSCPCNQVWIEGDSVSWLWTKFGLTRLPSSLSLIQEIFLSSQSILIYHEPQLHPWSWLMLWRIFRKLSRSSQQGTWWSLSPFTSLPGHMFQI